MGVGRSVPDGLSSQATEPVVSALRASIPSATIDHDRCIGIVNPYGELWTWNAFESCDEAEKHLRDFWGKQADEMAPKFKLCEVRVEVIPESEPFDLPSAIATEARRAATTGAVHEGAGRQASPTPSPSHPNSKE